MFYVGHVNLVAPDKQLFFQLSVWRSVCKTDGFRRAKSVYMKGCLYVFG